MRDISLSVGIAHGSFQRPRTTGEFHRPQGTGHTFQGVGDAHRGLHVAALPGFHQMRDVMGMAIRKLIKHVEVKIALTPHALKPQLGINTGHRFGKYGGHSYGGGNHLCSLYSRDRRNPPDKSRKQSVEVNGLGDVVTHARFDRTVSVARKCMGGHGNDGDGWASLALPLGLRLHLPYFTHGCQAIHHGHLNIHKDGIINPDLHFPESFQSVVGNIHAEPSLFQVLQGHLTIDLVVFDQKNTGTPDMLEAVNRIVCLNFRSLLDRVSECR